MKNSPTCSTRFVSHKTRKQAKLDRTVIHDQFKKLCSQELLPQYTCKDYLSFADDMREKADRYANSAEPIDIHCRVRMVEWCFQVVDFAKLHRETVSVALSFLDRYLSTLTPHAREVIISRKRYQLASMSALFLAIKLCEKAVINASVFADLSRGSYTAEDVLEMESIILKALDWRVNGPSTHELLRYVVQLSSDETKDTFVTEASFKELCNFQLDLSIGDYFFCTQRHSITATAAIVNAVENARNLGASGTERFFKKLSEVSEVDINSKAVNGARNRLKILLKTNGVDLEQSKQIAKAERGASPSCISGMSRVVSDVSMNEVVQQF